MSLQFLNSDRVSNRNRKEYLKPDEILSDPYLTSAQKYVVLEALLAETRDAGEEKSSRQNLRLADEIIRAQAKLRTEMD